VILQLRVAKSAAPPVTAAVAPRGSSAALESMLDFLEAVDDEGVHEGSWLNAEPYEDEPSIAEQATVLLAFCFDSLKNLHGVTVEALQDASNRTKEQKRVIAERYQQVNYMFALLLRVSSALHNDLMLGKCS
jgi:hypothetical protein